jgi:hypothetical protein
MRAPVFASCVPRNRRYRQQFSEALSELVDCLLKGYGRHNQFVPLSLQPLKECSEVTSTQSEITHECSGIDYDLHPFSPV